MDNIQLPMTRCMHTGAWGLILTCGILILASDVDWPWRLSGFAALCCSGAWLWRRYLRLRPMVLHAAADHSLACTLADGRIVRVSRVRLGIVHPALVSARLRMVDGGSRDLFVPGWSVSQDAHWRLRRAMLGFRPASKGAGAAGQPSERRGT